MRVNLMIEGQEDVGWQEWLDLAGACEEHGLEGLFRSDHYDSVQGHHDRGSLDAWTTIAALAARTGRIRLGTMVSPVTFRHPSLLAKAVVTADHVSGGRVELGIGAGWNEHEHAAYGFPFPGTGERFELLEEQIAIVHRQWTEVGFDLDGEHYTLEDCRPLPHPVQDPHPNLIVGGMANPRSAGIAARWADEYNTVFAGPGTCRERRSAVEEAWEAEGRDPGDLTFSVMTACLVGEDRDELRARGRRHMERAGDDGDVDGYLDRHRDDWVIGTVEEVVDRLAVYEEHGVDRIMLQHLDHRDLDMVELLGTRVVPEVAR